MLARMAPGFFLGSVGGVLVDRWNRKRVLVLCNLGRAAILCTLPLVDTVWGLVLVSLALEVLTLLWSPAKEAEVPNLVPTDKLSAANSLSLAAAYGTFPVAAALSAVLFKLAGPINDLGIVDINHESVAIYFNALAFIVSAVLIWTIHMPRRGRRNDGPINLRQTFDELKDGWRFIGSNPVVQAVMIGLATGLFGGGMVVPLGPDFSRQVLGGGAAGFSLLYTALGLAWPSGSSPSACCSATCPGSACSCSPPSAPATSLMVAATVVDASRRPCCSSAPLGLCAGASYVVGFTLLQENVADELRGRIFATLYTVIRLLPAGRAHPRPVPLAAARRAVAGGLRSRPRGRRAGRPHRPAGGPAHAVVRRLRSSSLAGVISAPPARPDGAREAAGPPHRLRGRGGGRQVDPGRPAGSPPRRGPHPRAGRHRAGRGDPGCSSSTRHGRSTPAPRRC